MVCVVGRIHIILIRAVIRTIIPAILLFSPIIVAISYVIYSYLLGHTVSIDMLLGIVILFQTYIIWIQVEISLRQTEVSKTEYEPTLKVNIRDATTVAGVYPTPLIGSIENVGQYPAYNLMFGLINKTTGKPIDGNMRLRSGTQTLAPKDSPIDILQYPIEMNNAGIEINVTYWNITNEMRDITFMKFAKNSEFALVSAPLNTKQGILLRSLENFNLAFRIMKLRRNLKNRQVS